MINAGISDKQAIQPRVLKFGQWMTERNDSEEAQTRNYHDDGQWKFRDWDQASVGAQPRSPKEESLETMTRRGPITSRGLFSDRPRIPRLPRTQSEAIAMLASTETPPFTPFYSRLRRRSPARHEEPGRIDHEFLLSAFFSSSPPPH
ncbi:hypothetical protein NM208_g16089 [Fusarium decemcellulare]|uniref:Uncharacterized protein n=1 Tax=Fusarium decemcellulare TaxID=57161 RepID=A0ACC1RB59_9HYPO|nr:hypothetical protein NM208_g16089 [Fusarium decemcellulare]